MFRRALAHADRGKPRWQPDFDDRDPNTFLFPALNHHSDEISCGVGLASLSRLHETIVRRLSFVTSLTARLLDEETVCQPYGYSPGDSPFVYPIIVDVDRITCPKIDFARAVLAEGIGLNPHYRYLVADWPFVKPHLALPLVPLAWFLGGWKRAAGLVAVVAGLNLAGGALTGSPLLVLDYLRELAGRHQAVTFNRAADNPQISSWNRALIAAGALLAAALVFQRREYCDAA